MRILVISPSTWREDPPGQAAKPSERAKSDAADMGRRVGSLNEVTALDTVVGYGCWDLGCTKAGAGGFKSKASKILPAGGMDPHDTPERIPTIISTLPSPSSF